MAQDDGTALVTVTNDGKFALEYDSCDSLFHIQLIEQADMISMNQASSDFSAGIIIRFRSCYGVGVR